MSTTRYSCDYAKRVAGCKKCKLQLVKGTLRFAKITPNPFVQNEDGPPPDMKQYFHPECLFETFYKARATTKVIEEPGDVEDWSQMNDEDKERISKLIDDLMAVRGSKTSGAKTPKKKVDTPNVASSSQQTSKKISPTLSQETPKTTSRSEKKVTKVNEQSVKKEVKPEVTSKSDKPTENSKYNSFNKFCKLCEVIQSVSKYTEKSAAVKSLIGKDNFDGDTVLWLEMLIPSIDQRVYNLKEKQIMKHFAVIFDLNQDQLSDEYKQVGDVSQVIRKAVDEIGACKDQKSDWTIQKVNRWLNKLTELTKDDEQVAHFKFVAKRLPGLELMYLLRLIKKDLRFNAGVKHILDGLHPQAYEAFQNCRDLEEIVSRCKEGKLGGQGPIVAIKLGTPVLPMLAEACKSVEQAMKRCPNGMFSEIKYDGERVQVHKNGETFTFFSRSLKPVQNHKVAEFEKCIPQAFAGGDDLIIDAEVLMVDTTTGKPLPFGTLGVHKKEKFKDACVCLFVFDILRYNDDILMDMPLCKRKKLLEEHMKEVPNKIQFSNYQLIAHGDNHKLKTMIFKAIDEGLEGLVLKDTQSAYEPGKRHWLKVKKDYLEEGKMADTADLVVLGAYYGTGSKGGMMSVFLMGVLDSDTNTYRTVTKCGNGHTDDQLDKINKELKLEMQRIDDYSNLPVWLKCSRQLLPDFIVKDPKKAPVWEITGAEFSKSDNHTAGGVSIRFPRVTRIRDDKDWSTATNLAELKKLYDTSKEKCDVDKTVEDNIPLYAKGEDALLPDEIAGSSASIVDKNANANDDKNKKHDRKRESDRELGDSPKAKKQSDKSEKAAVDVCPQGETPCKFGDKCYRKNADHKAEFWHPKK